MDLNQKVDVQIEALPVVSAVLDNTKKSHVEVVGIIEHDGKQAVNARELHAEINVDAFELIKVEERDGKQAVNARGLHRFLGIGKDFSSWIKKQIERCDLTENIDYQSFTQKGEREIGGTVRIEYALSVDAAKEISMMSQCEKGKQARRYFIEMEKRARMQGVPSYQIDDEIERANRWIEEHKEKRALIETNKKQQLLLEQKQVENDKLVADGKRKDATIVRMKPKEVFTDAVAGSKGNCLIGECAKLITQNGYKIGEKQFFAWLREKGYLGKKGERYNIPNQQYVGKNALFYIKKGVRTGNSGVLHTTSTTMLTPKGQIYFVNKFLGKGGLQGDLFANGEARK